MLDKIKLQRWFLWWFLQITFKPAEHLYCIYDRVRWAVNVLKLINPNDAPLLKLYLDYNIQIFDENSIIFEQFYIFHAKRLQHSSWLITLWGFLMEEKEWKYNIWINHYPSLFPPWKTFQSVFSNHVVTFRSELQFQNNL